MAVGPGGPLPSAEGHAAGQPHAQRAGRARGGRSLGQGARNAGGWGPGKVVMVNWTQLFSIHRTLYNSYIYMYIYVWCNLFFSSRKFSWISDGSVSEATTSKIMLFGWFGSWLFLSISTGKGIIAGVTRCCILWFRFFIPSWLAFGKNTNIIWLVVWNSFYDFPYIGKFIIPTDFNSIIFQRGRAQPPARLLWTIINHIITININHILIVYYQPANQMMFSWT